MKNKERWKNYQRLEGSEEKWQLSEIGPGTETKSWWKTWGGRNTVSSLVNDVVRMLMSSFDKSPTVMEP